MKMTMTEGTPVMILPAYEMATGRRSHVDEIAWRRAIVQEVRGVDVLIWLVGDEAHESGGEVWINAGRLEM